MLFHIISCLRMHIGCDPVHNLEDRQVRVDDPDSPYPVLHLKVVLPSTNKDETDKEPKLGRFRAGHTTGMKFRKTILIIIISNQTRN